MKRFLAIFFVLASFARADQPYSFADFFYVAPSVSNKYYAVYTLVSTKPDEKKPWDGAVPRLQVFNSADGKLSWEIEPPFVSKDSFYLTDLDGIWVQIPYWLWNEKPLDQPVVTIYQKDKKVVSYTLRQLGYQESTFENSVSHSRFADTSRPIQEWRNSLPTNGEEGAAYSEFCNPKFKGNTMTFKLNDGSIHIFDLTTGQLKKEKS